MAIYTRIPPVNPLRFVEYGRIVPNNKYHFAAFDKDLARLNIRKGQRDVGYDQKVQNDQNITIQAHSTADAPYLHVIDCHENTIATIAVSGSYAMPGNLYGAIQLTTYQWTFKLSAYSLPDDRYWIILGFNDPTAVFADQPWIREPFLLQDAHLQTSLIEYSHDRNEYDVVFGAPLYPNFCIRIDGLVVYDKPVSVTTDYKDASYRPHLLSAYPDRDISLVLGYDQQVPEWMTDKVDNIVDLKRWTVDGKLFVRKTGAQWEVTDTKTFPLQSAILSILEGDRQSNFELISNNLLVFTAPDFPFALGRIRVGGPSTGYVDVTGAVIEDAPGLTDYVAAMTTLAGFTSLSGYFYEDSGNVYYSLAVGENLNFADAEVEPYHFNLSVNSLSINSQFKVGLYNLLGGEVVIDWGDGSIEYNSAPNGQILHVLPAIDIYTVRVFHNDTLEKITYIQASTQAQLNTITGVLPSSLKQFTILFANLISFDFDILQRARHSLTTLSITFSELSTVAGNMFALGYFGVLSNINLKNNELTSSGIDDFIFNYYNYAAWLPGPGTINVKFQTPPAPPVTSISNIAALTAAGKTIISD